MRAVVSRVLSARVDVTEDDQVVTVGELPGPGLLALVGVTHEDSEATARKMADKLLNLRILRDEQSCASTGAGMLIVSQFTLYGDTGSGRRPGWSAAAPGPVAEPLIEAVVARLREQGALVQTGRFGAMMAVHSVNDGPFTVLVELT